MGKSKSSRNSKRQDETLDIDESMDDTDMGGGGGGEESIVTDTDTLDTDTRGDDGTATLNGLDHPTFMSEEDFDAADPNSPRFDRFLDPILKPVCRPFAGDPAGSVERVWILCMICVLILIISACSEAKDIHDTNMSFPVMIITIMVITFQLFLGLGGTFIMRRFPTEFSVGVFLGFLVIMAQQNLILGIFFSDGSLTLQTEISSNQTFAALLLLTSTIYFLFAIMLSYFREYIILAPVDVKSVLSKLESQDGMLDESTMS